MNDIIWLHDAGLEHTPLIGAKAARLGELTRRRFHVPPAFCVTAQACGRPFSVSFDLRDGILAACARLAQESPAGPVFAVRSSSPAEDLATTSFAGQYNTFLNVALPDVPARVADCCASAASRRTLAYRQERGLAAQSPQMAVLVQIMIPCQVAAVAFSRDPLSGEKSIVIEAAAGLGKQVVGGTTTPHRYTILPDSPLPDGDDLLSNSTLRQLADLVPAIEQTLGGTQDIESGLWQNTLYVLQARPITVLPASDNVFSEPSDPGVVWTSGFFDERFPQPVSALGWSVLKDIVEQYAFRETLQFLGTPGCELWRLIRLYNGHPYTNMRVFQTIYKIFPDALLPEDASRFFIDRDAGLRQKVPYPRGLFDPRLIFSMLRYFVRDPRNWSPLHNWRLWQDFTCDYDARLRRAQQLQQRSAADLPAAARDVQTLNGRLLAILRRVYLLLGRSLPDHGITDQENNDFFLTAGEVASLVTPGAGIGRAEGGERDETRATVAARRGLFARLTRAWMASPILSYPPFLPGNEPILPARKTGNTLRGQPVSPGIARGQACVLLSIQEVTYVPKGCILVVPSADPAWTPLFSHVAGLVLEVGGQLSHGAVVAREYGLPTVAGIAGVASTIKTGDIVTVDGSSGIVMHHGLGLEEDQAVSRATA